MKRHYTDLHFRPNLNDAKQTLNMIDKAANLGYHQIGIAFPPNYAQQTISQIREACTQANIDLITRLDLQPKTPNELLYSLRKLRRKFETICVMCCSKDVSRQAAKDRRVDLLNFAACDFRRRFFDMAEAELASNSLAALEVDMKPILTLEGPSRAKTLTSLRREAEIAEGFRVPIVVSSGVSSEMLLRRPIELAALTALFDLNKETALDAVSRTPQAIVKRNREKLDLSFVAPGIRVVKRGKDC